jgi:uncharacterized damage-inducible protein DinB
LAYFDGLLVEAESALANATDEQLNGTWSMRHGDEVYFTLPRAQALRLFCLNHMVHHRGQLSVYLKLLGIPVPATYGPSTDDYELILTDGFA